MVPGKNQFGLFMLDSEVENDPRLLYSSLFQYFFRSNMVPTLVKIPNF